MPLSKEQMREYMRKRRADKKGLLGKVHVEESLVLSEKESVVQTDDRGSDVVTSKGCSKSALPWPLNPDKSPRWGDGVEHYIAPTEEEKEAMALLGLEKSRILREERKKR